MLRIFALCLAGLYLFGFGQGAIIGILVAESNASGEIVGPTIVLVLTAGAVLGVFAGTILVQRLQEVGALPRWP